MVNYKYVKIFKIVKISIMIMISLTCPLLIDNVTKNKLFGHYARVLVDLDLFKDIFYEVLVEREGFAFQVAIEYEGLPEFCTHCKSIGHNVTSCCWLLHPRSVENNEHQTDKGKKSVNSKRPKQGWKPMDNPEGIRLLAPPRRLKFRHSFHNQLHVQKHYSWPHLSRRMWRIFPHRLCIE